MTTKAQSAGIGVAVYTILSLATSFLYFNGSSATTSLAGVLACLVAIIAPVVAVWHFTSTNQETLLPGPGAGLGAATAAGGAFAGTLIAWALQQAGMFPSNGEMMARQRTQMIEQGLSPEEADRLMGMVGGMSESLVSQLGSSIVIGLIVGAIAGAIAALVFKKGDAELM